MKILQPILVLVILVAMAFAFSYASADCRKQGGYYAKVFPYPWYECVK